MVWQVFPLLLSLLIISISADVFDSIDCGSSDLFYTDGNSIVWTGDDSLIQNGVSQVVQPSNSISKVMDTLRVFTTRNKNCYSVKTDANERVLVRASFHYGNYDKKSSPPSFDLQFDGNEWVTVQTLLDQVVYYEVIYVVKGESLSVCLAQTKPDQFPFISALEVRSLGASMYSHVDANYALFLNRRVAYGTNQTIRYMDDIYDRIWNPNAGSNGLLTLSSDALFIANDGGDNPPQAVLQNAITVSNESTVIQLNGFGPWTLPVYLNMYFSEATQLDSTQKRSFRVFEGNQSFSDPISPPYGNFTELYAANITFSSNTTFYLEATPDSTLPPLINALEVFLISNQLTSGTNSKDVDGLATLQLGLPLLQVWSGDPCLPAPYTWDWINCSSDAIPRVTSLSLSSFGLSGSLPDFSSMDSLETIDLQNNSFVGPIPDFLSTFPNLKQLNLANNQFSGPIPASLSKKNGLNLVVTGNPDLCTSDKPCQTTSTTATTTAGRAARGKKKSNKLPVILGTTIPVFLLFWAIVAVFAIFQHRGKAAAVVAGNTGQVGSSSPSPLLMNPQMKDAFGEVDMNNHQTAVDMNNGQSISSGPPDHYTNFVAHES